MLNAGYFERSKRAYEVLSIPRERKEWALSHAGNCSTGLINLLGGSIRWIKNDTVSKGSGIYAFWHEDLIMLPYIYKQFGASAPVTVLTSPHDAGRIAAHIAESYSMKVIQGCRNEGGPEALRRLLTTLRSEESIAICPDGTRGPAYTVKHGIIHLAKLSGVPIYPIACEFERYLSVSKTWDGTKIPYPRTRGSFVIGECLEVPLSASKDDYQVYACRLEDSLQATHLRARAAFLTQRGC